MHYQFIPGTCFVFPPRARLYVGDFMGAELRGAELQWANLQGTNLFGADLGAANLFRANGLTFKILSKVKTLYAVKGLDLELEKELRAIKPELFEKSSD